MMDTVHQLPIKPSTDMPPSTLQELQAQAFWFGDESCPLLGWYHPPRAAIRHCGVVLCAPFGHEYLVAYRAYKKLALRLADAGFPVCFFDYDGCGDSADSDGPRVKAWQHSISLAIQALKQMSGVPEVALFGVRMGALLAASVAGEEAIVALALVAPVISGRSYVRELLALSRMSGIPASPDPERAVNNDEVTGYPLDELAQADLGKLDLLKIAPALQAPFFISARDDITGQEGKLVNLLREQGRDVTMSSNGGYAAMMSSDAYNSQVPDALWSELVDWMKRQFDQPAAAGDPVCRIQPQLETITQIRLPDTVVQEELVAFDGLSGVLTEPCDRNSAHSIAVVLTNIGSGHRVGNHRLYVNLARTLATQGFRVLRFDRAGMGYSRLTPQGQENEVYAESGVADVRAAMDFLGRHRAHTGFVLAGLCSGAYFSYHAAVVDSRAKGLIMINPLTFHWRQGDSLEQRIRNTYKSNGFYLRSIVKPATWTRAFKGDVDVRGIAAKLMERGLMRVRRVLTVSNLRSSVRPPALAATVADNFRHMATRGVEFMFIFASDDSAIDVVNEQLGQNASLLGNSTRLRTETVHNTDHTFTPRWSQKYLQTLIAGYLAERFNY